MVIIFFIIASFIIVQQKNFFYKISYGAPRQKYRAGPGYHPKVRLGGKQHCLQ
jgi:hypothetical protein